jgi:cysteinyl-tRNA synthetase
MAALGVIKPPMSSRVPPNIFAEMIAQIEQLIARDHAYATQRGMCFFMCRPILRTASCPAAAAMSRLRALA